MDLKAPIYFSTGLTEKANHYYKLFIPWTNQKIRKTFVQRNMFEFKHIKAFDRAFADSPGPMVCPDAAGGGGGREFHLARARLQGAACLCARKVGGQKARRVGGASAALTVPTLVPKVVFATPGMLHAGQSLQIFRKWAGNEKNMVRGLGPRAGSLGSGAALAGGLLPLGTGLASWCLRSDPG